MFEIMFGHFVTNEIVFEACGTFKAIHKAEEHLAREGYTVGPMCCNEPIGFAKDMDYIAKWRNIDPSDYPRLNGVIISDDFREGSVKIIYLKGAELFDAPRIVT